MSRALSILVGTAMIAVGIWGMGVVSGVGYLGCLSIGLIGISLILIGIHRPPTKEK